MTDNALSLDRLRAKKKTAMRRAYCCRVEGGASWSRSQMVSAAVASGRLGSEEMRVGRPRTAERITTRREEL